MAGGYAYGGSLCLRARRSRQRWIYLCISARGWEAFSRAKITGLRDVISATIRRGGSLNTDIVSVKSKSVHDSQKPLAEQTARGASSLLYISPNRSRSALLCVVSGWDKTPAFSAGTRCDPNRDRCLLPVERGCLRAKEKKERDGHFLYARPQVLRALKESGNGLALLVTRSPKGKSSSARVAHLTERNSGPVPLSYPNNASIPPPRCPRQRSPLGMDGYANYNNRNKDRGALSPSPQTKTKTLAGGKRLG